MPSDEYFLTKQFFGKMTEDGEAHEKLSFTEFKHSRTDNEHFLDPVYRTTSMSCNSSISNIWKPITTFGFYIEKGVYFEEQQKTCKSFRCNCCQGYGRCKSKACRKEGKGNCKGF